MTLYEVMNITVWAYDRDACATAEVVKLGEFIIYVIKYWQVPSRTALATSVASARVGRRLSVIVSTTRVTITGFPAMLHLYIAAF